MIRLLYSLQNAVQARQSEVVVDDKKFLMAKQCVKLSTTNGKKSESSRQQSSLPFQKENYFSFDNKRSSFVIEYSLSAV